MNSTTEQTAIAIFQNRMAVHRERGRKGYTWAELPDTAKDEYRSMARAAVAVIWANILARRQVAPTFTERLAAWWHRFKSQHIVTDDPLNHHTNW